MSGTMNTKVAEVKAMLDEFCSEIEELRVVPAETPLPRFERIEYRAPESPEEFEAWARLVEARKAARMTDDVNGASDAEAGLFDWDQADAEWRELVDEDRLLDAEDRVRLAWLHRDSDCRTEAGRIRGTGRPVGFEGEHEWLMEVLGQLRVEYVELRREAAEAKRVPIREASGFAQVQAIQRHAEALRSRYNFNRYVEALGADPAEADERRRAAKLSYAAAVQRLELVAQRKRAYEDFSVPGLI